MGLREKRKNGLCRQLPEEPGPGQSPEPVGGPAAYAASAGTAAAGVDFTPVVGTLTFGPGGASKTFVVPILDDAVLFEAGGTVHLTLSGPAGGATLRDPAAAVLTIAEDDGVRVPARPGGTRPRAVGP